MTSARSIKRSAALLLYMLPGVAFCVPVARLIKLPAFPLAVGVSIVVLLLLALSWRKGPAPYIDLLLLGFYLVAFNLVYLGDIVLDMPRDTTSYFEYFYAFYNHLYQFGRIPLWFPDMIYGVRTALYQVGFVAPTSYLLMGLGKLLNVENVYLLFVGSSLLQQVIFLLGTYALAGVLGFSRLTRFLLGFIAAASLLWYQHYFFELQVVYLLPAQLFLVHRACTTHRAGYLLFLALTFAVWLMGGLYAPILGFYVCLLFGLVLLVTMKKWPALTFARRDLIPLTAFFVLFGVIAALVIVAYKDSAFPGRGFATLANSQPLGTRSGLESLNHLVINFLDPLNGNVFTRSSFEQNLHTYIGLLPLILLFYAFWKREAAGGFHAAWITGFFVLWLTFNGLFAGLAIHLPFLADYRWLGLSYPIVRLLFAVAAMSGFERGIRDGDDARSLLVILILMAFVLDGGLAMIQEEQGAAYSVGNLRILLQRLGFYVLAVLIPAIMALLKRLRGLPLDPWLLLKYTLSLALMLDLLSYQLIWATLLPRQRQTWSQATIAAVTTVDEIRYLPERPLHAGTSRSRLIKQQDFFHDFHYPIANQFAQFDPCHPQERVYVQITEARTDGIRRLLEQLNSPGVPYSDSVEALIGCQSSKLRFVPGTVIDTQPITAAQLVAQDLVSNVVLADETTHGLVPPARNGTDEKIAVTSYSYDGLTIDVENPYDPGAWLFYSDSYQAGWHTTLDGKPARLYRADINFKAVWVPAGRHTVTFEFINPALAVLQTALFWLGAAATLALLFLLLLAGRRHASSSH